MAIQAPPAVHAAVDVIWAHFADPAKAQSEEPPTAKPEEPATANANGSGREDRPDFSLLPSRKWEVILSLVWDNPGLRYGPLAETAERQLGKKVTEKDVASYVFLANGDDAKRPFVHPSKRTSRKT